MGWESLVPGSEYIKKGMDAAEAVGGLKGAYDKAKDNEYVQKGVDIARINTNLEIAERRLKEIGADQIDISPNKRSELAEFLQKGLKAMDQDVGVIDGKAGAGTVRELNGFFVAKVESAKDGYNPLRDKYEDLKPIEDITELTGRHIQAFVDELRERDILDSGTPEMLKEFGQALREIGDKRLIEPAAVFDPDGTKKNAPEVEPGIRTRRRSSLDDVITEPDGPTEDVATVKSTPSVGMGA